MKLGLEMADGSSRVSGLYLCLRAFISALLIESWPACTFTCGRKAMSATDVAMTESW